MKKLVSLLMALAMVLSMGVVTFADGLPDAEVSVLKPITLTKEEHGYMCWPSGDATVERPLQIVMNFKANDTLEEAKAGKYGKYVCDFYLEFSGLKNDSIIADGCYLAGNYGPYGWIVIPVDGLEVEEGISYPVVSGYDVNLTYENICDYVKNFTAAIYISDAILEENPDFKISLSLKMTEPVENGEVLTVGEPAVYDVEDLKSGNEYIEDYNAAKEEVIASEEIGGTIDADENADAIAAAKENLKEMNPNIEQEVLDNGELSLEVSFYDMELDENGSPSIISYDVTPVFSAGEDNTVELSQLNAEVTFKLPVPGTETRTKAKVYHEEDYIGIYEIKGVETGKYVEVSSKTFSVFSVEPISVTQGEPEESAPSSAETVTIVIDATGKADAEKETEDEENPNTGAPVMMPVMAVLAVLSGAVISKK